MKLPHDLAIWCRGGSGGDLDNEMRLIGLTRLGEMHFVPRPYRAFLPAVAGLDIIGRCDEQC